MDVKRGLSHGREECWLGVFKYTGLKKIYLDPKYRK
jgi:hypothetical protein